MISREKVKGRPKKTTIENLQRIELECFCSNEMCETDVQNDVDRIW